MVKRGDIVLVSLAGDYSKPRPALIVQSNATLGVTGSVTFRLNTSELVESRLRIEVAPDLVNGLKTRSQIQIDKVYALPDGKIRAPIGTIDADRSDRVDLALALHLDLIAP